MISGIPSRDFCADLASTEIIAGVDEAGRGPLAGPVVAAAVVLCKNPPEGIADSKKLTARKRGLLEPLLRQSCAFGIGVVEREDIDRLNILGATMLAMSLATQNLADALGQDPAMVLIDGNMTPHKRCDLWRWPARAIIGGDALEPAISAASVLAKEYRDRIMIEAAKSYPQYGWERNKGYGSKEHMAALKDHGITPLHRRSFAPVAQLALI